MARKHDNWNDVQETICPSCEKSLRVKFGGTPLYVPKDKDAPTQFVERDRQILLKREEGMPIAQIAIKFNLTVGRINQILAEARNRTAEVERAKATG